MKKLFRFQFFASQIQINRGAFAGFRPYAVAQVIADPFAQIKTESACFFIRPAVQTGVAAFKYSGQIFGRDADAGVLYAKYTRCFHGNSDFAAGGRVFYGVGKDLLNHKQKPFFVRKRRKWCFFIFQFQFFLNELTGKMPKRLF